MEAVGIFIMAAGLWISYCSIYGINPLDAAKTIIQNPGQWRQVISDAKAASKAKYSSLFAGLGLAANMGVIGGGSNPFSGYQITCDWKCHTSRNPPSKGGVDYAMPVGTPLPTPFAGTVQNLPNSGTGGNIVHVKMDNGYTIEYMHLSKYAVSNGTKVGVGSIVGYSGGAKGAEGAGDSTGPHVHVDMIDPSGTRINFLDYIGNQVKAA